MVRLARVSAGTVALLAIRGTLRPVAQLLRLRSLRRHHPELMDPKAALAAVIAALEQDG